MIDEMTNLLIDTYEDMRWDHTVLEKVIDKAREWGYDVMLTTEGTLTIKEKVK